MIVVLKSAGLLYPSDTVVVFSKLPSDFHCVSLFHEDEALCVDDIVVGPNRAGESVMFAIVTNRGAAPVNVRVEVLDEAEVEHHSDGVRKRGT